jgi:ABC-type Fe3+-hydroxamate transport system substrate-binding protein
VHTWIGWRLLWTLVLAVSAVGPAVGAAAIQARDDTGQVVTLPKAARRVVSLAPSGTEMLFAIGAGGLVKAVSDYDDYPPEAKTRPKVGSFSGPDPERIVAAKPDLVVAAYGNPLELIDRLRRQHLSVYISNPQTVDGVLRNLADLGRLTGQDAGAKQRVRELQQRLRQVAQRVGHSPPVNTLVVIWDEPLTVAGGRSFIQDVLRRAGGTNAARGLTEAYPKLDPERLVTLDPAVVLFPVANDAARVQRLKDRAGFRQTTAARTGRIYSLNPDWLMRAGPRVVQGVEAVARLLHPSAFSRQASH